MLIISIIEGILEDICIGTLAKHVIQYKALVCQLGSVIKMYH